MQLEFDIEDRGAFRRLHTKGPHTHEAGKDAAVCEECRIDLPFSTAFIRQLIEWDSTGFFHFIGERLCNDTFNKGAKNLINRFCSDLSDFLVLDFGSGLGQLSSYFFELGARKVILTEINAQLLELSRTYMRDNGHTEDCEYYLLKECDELDMLEDGSIDMIVASEVFEHVLPCYREETLKRLYSKLKPGGIILITAPNRLFPKDYHTTGLWLAAWLPSSLGAWYARTFASWRWKDRSTEDMLRQGLRQYSYFEARRILKPLGACNLCRQYPVEDKGLRDHRTLKGHVYYHALNIIFNMILKYIGPWEAWQPGLELAWSKPIAQ